MFKSINLKILNKIKIAVVIMAFCLCLAFGTNLYAENNRNIDGIDVSRLTKFINEDFIKNILEKLKSMGIFETIAAKVQTMVINAGMLNLNEADLKKIDLNNIDLQNLDLNGLNLENIDIESLINDNPELRERLKEYEEQNNAEFDNMLKGLID